MTREAAERIAVGLETLARAVRDAVAVEPDARRPLAEVAAEKGIPSSSLRELCSSRKVTAVKQGKGWLVRPSDVDAYLSRRESRARVPLVARAS